MRTTLLALAAALSLSACIEVEMDVAIVGQDEARVTGYMQMSRAMFDMSQGDTSFCTAEEGGTLTVSAEFARCDFLRTGTFAEIMTPPGGAEQADAGPQAEIVWLDTNRVRVLFPLGDMGGGMEEMSGDPQMEAMFRQMMAGFAVRMRVSGAEIESSTGEISADGKSAVLALTLDDLFDKDSAKLVDFDTVVKY